MARTLVAQLQTGAAEVASARASMSIGSSGSARKLLTRLGTGQPCSMSFGDRFKSSTPASGQNSARHSPSCSVSVRGSFVGKFAENLNYVVISIVYGSPGRIRTSDQPVNRLWMHWAANGCEAVHKISY